MGTLQAKLQKNKLVFAAFSIYKCKKNCLQIFLLKHLVDKYVCGCATEIDL